MRGNHKRRHEEEVIDQFITNLSKYFSKKALDSFRSLTEDAKSLCANHIYPECHDYHKRSSYSGCSVISIAIGCSGQLFAELWPYVDKSNPELVSCNLISSFYNQLLLGRKFTRLHERINAFIDNLDIVFTSTTPAAFRFTLTAEETDGLIIQALGYGIPKDQIDRLVTKLITYCAAALTSTQLEKIRDEISKQPLPKCTAALRNRFNLIPNAGQILHLIQHNLYLADSDSDNPKIITHIKAYLSQVVKEILETFTANPTILKEPFLMNIFHAMLLTKHNFPHKLEWQSFWKALLNSEDKLTSPFRSNLSKFWPKFQCTIDSEQMIEMDIHGLNALSLFLHNNPTLTLDHKAAHLWRIIMAKAIQYHHPLIMQLYLKGISLQGTIDGFGYRVSDALQFIDFSRLENSEKLQKAIADTPLKSIFAITPMHIAASQLLAAEQFSDYTLWPQNLCDLFEPDLHGVTTFDLLFALQPTEVTLLSRMQKTVKGEGLGYVFSKEQLAVFSSLNTINDQLYKSSCMLVVIQYINVTVLAKLILDYITIENEVSFIIASNLQATVTTYINLNKLRPLCDLFQVHKIQTLLSIAEKILTTHRDIGTQEGELKRWLAHLALTLMQRTVIDSAISHITPEKAKTSVMALHSLPARKVRDLSAAIAKVYQCILPAQNYALTTDFLHMPRFKALATQRAIKYSPIFLPSVPTATPPAPTAVVPSAPATAPSTPPAPTAASVIPSSLFAHPKPKKPKVVDAKEQALLHQTQHALYKYLSDDADAATSGGAMRRSVPQIRPAAQKLINEIQQCHTLAQLADWLKNVNFEPFTAILEQHGYLDRWNNFFVTQYDIIRPEDHTITYEA